MGSTQPVRKRSYPCNGEMLVYLRERNGWTQQELVATSGYSERLISKAESGRTISAATIEVLAKTLSTEEDPIWFEDLICDTVALAKEFIKGIHVHQRQWVSAVRHFLDDDIVIRFAGDPEKIAFAGEYHGIAAFEKVTELFFSVLEVPSNVKESKHSYMAQGKDVILWGESWLHPIGMPMEQPMPFTSLFRFRRGKLILFDDMFDTLQGAAVLDGLVPRD